MPEYDRQFPYCPRLLEISSSCGADTLGWDGSGTRLCWRTQDCAALPVDLRAVPDRLPALAILQGGAPLDIAQRGLEERIGGW